MKKEIEKRNELIGLKEINQVETSEVNGGCVYLIQDIKDILIVCCYDIPPHIPRNHY